MEDNEMRNNLLMELIDKMQDRLAEKAYPEEKPKEEEIIAAVTEEPKEETDAKAEETETPEDLDLEAELINSTLEQ